MVTKIKKRRETDEFPVEKLSVDMRNAMLSEQRAIGDKVFGFWILVCISLRVVYESSRSFRIDYCTLIFN